MRIKSVSPLIATIILIALTVSIGAIIVGWGRSYIQKQMMCTGFSLYISDYRVTNSSLVLIVQNTGNAIDLGRYTLQTYITSNNIAIEDCGYNTSEYNCIVEYLDGRPYSPYDTIKEGIYFMLNLTGYNSTNLPQSVKILIKGCGDVSNTVIFVS